MSQLSASMRLALERHEFGSVPPGYRRKPRFEESNPDSRFAELPHVHQQVVIQGERSVGTLAEGERSNPTAVG